MKRFTLLLIISLLFNYTFPNIAIDVTEEPQNWQKREHSYRSKDSFGAFQIVYRGDIVVSANDKEVESISPGGYLRISKTSFGNERIINIESNSDGELTKTFMEGKNQLDFEKEGKEWLADILLDVIRKTGISAHERIERIYKNKGIYGVLDEIDIIDDNSSAGSYVKVVGIYYQNISITGGSVKNLYCKILVNDIQLKKEDLIPTLRLIGDIGSNSTKGVLLRTILDKYQLDEYLMEKFLDVVSTHEYNTERGNTLRKFQSIYKIDRKNYREYFDVIRGMSINSEKGNVLKPLLESQQLEPRVMIELLETVTEFAESEKAAVLRKAVKYLGDDQQVNNAFKEAVYSLSSPWYLLKDELLMLQRGGEETMSPGRDGMIDLLKTASEWEANTKKTTTLRKIHKSLTNDEYVIEKYFDVLRSMDNNLEKYNVILDLLDVHEFDKHGLNILLNTTEDIADDDFKHAASAILRKLISNNAFGNKYFSFINTDDLTRDSFFEVLKSIDHNSAKEEIIRMFCTHKNLEDKTIIELLKAAEDIEVDIETASSLLQIKKILPKQNSEVNYIYKSIARDIESDYDFEKVMKGLEL